MALLRRGGYFPGQLVKLYILAYLAYRFLTEFIRPEPVLAAGLTGYQWSALGIAPIFIWLWWRDARARRAVAETPEHAI
jgi:prolipoprotein diacylglyceryltransferase